MPLTITTKEIQLINEDTLEIITIPSETIVLEHSLAAMSKWERLWHDQFLKDREHVGDPLTREQMISYLECMTLNGPFDVRIYLGFDQATMNKIRAYMEDPMTGTKFVEEVGRGQAAGTVMSAEEIYYAMFKWNVPMECENWHINRLMALLRVYGEKENPKKQTQQQHMQEMYAKNAYRKAKNSAKMPHK